MSAQYKRSRLRKISLSPRFTMYRPGFQVCRMTWEFHLTDEDPQPSVPHGHSLGKDRKYRLSIWDGKVYKKQGGKLIYQGNASKKDMLKLYYSTDFQEFFRKAREWYEEKYKRKPPLIPLLNENIGFSRVARHNECLCQFGTSETFYVDLKVKFRNRNKRMKSKRNNCNSYY